MVLNDPVAVTFKALTSAAVWPVASESIEASPEAKVRSPSVIVKSPAVKVKAPVPSADPAMVTRPVPRKPKVGLVAALPNAIAAPASKVPMLM